jgi:hypothetical protein
MTSTIPIKKIDGLPPDLVRLKPIRRRKIIGHFDRGVFKMARGPLAFKQTDITRALRAASAAGQPVQRFEIDREGKIVVFVGKPQQPEEAGDNEWDRV